MKSHAYRKPLNESRPIKTSEQIDSEYQETLKRIEAENQKDWKVVLRKIWRENCQRGTSTIRVSRFNQNYDLEIEKYDYRKLLRLVSQALFFTNRQKMPQNHILHYSLDEESHDIEILDNQTQEVLIYRTLNDNYWKSAQLSSDKIYIVFELLIGCLLGDFYFDLTPDEFQKFSKNLANSQDI